MDDVDLCNGVVRCLDGTCGVDPSTIVDCSAIEVNECQAARCNPRTGSCNIVRLEDARDCGADYCTRGVCAGGACEPDVACASCEHCDPELEACVVSTGFCKIGGSCVADGAPRAPGDCWGCDAAYPGSWTPSRRGTQCEATDPCFETFECDGGGTCRGAQGKPPPPPTPLRPVSGSRTGSPFAPPERGTLRPAFSWSPAPTNCLVSYELELDASCSSSSCEFRTPELHVSGLSAPAFRPEADLDVNRAPPVGRRYFWRVRACASEGVCSEWQVRYVDVGRAPRDFNGDGYTDLVVGSRWWFGHTLIFYGSSAGLVAASPQLLSQGAQFGGAGDVNGDGYTDWLGSDNLDPGVRAFVAYGSSSGVVEASGWQVTKTGGDAEVFADADFDADGFDDVVVGPGTSPLFADLYRGGPSGPSTLPSIEFPNPEPGSTNGATRLRTGDFNGDAIADLLANSGFFTRSFVLLGAVENMSVHPADEIAGLTRTSGTGYTTAVTDTNGDGRDDIVASLQQQAGAVYLFRSAQDLFSTEPSAVWHDATGNRYSGFGIDTAAGDLLAADGIVDIVVSAPQAGPGRKLYVFVGSDIVNVPPLVIENPERAVTFSFGNSLQVTGDFDGDGHQDLAVSDEDANDLAGAVHVYHGPLAGTPITPTLTIRRPQSVATADYFGNAFH